MCAQSLSHIQLFAAPWTVALQAPLSVGFSRKKYWSELPLPTPICLFIRDLRTHACTLEKEGYLIAHSVLTGSGALSSQRMCVCVLVAQSCPTLCDPMDCSPPGSSVHEIFQARVLESVAISYSRGSSQPRNRTRVSCTAGRSFTD